MLCASKGGAGIKAARDQKFTEPVALSSTSPTNLRLPPTALRSGFDLLALRARCTEEHRDFRTGLQERADAKLPHFAHSKLSTFPRPLRELGTSLWIVRLAEFGLVNGPEGGRRGPPFAT